MSRKLVSKLIVLTVVFALLVSGCNLPGRSGGDLSAEEQAQTMIAETLAAGGTTPQVTNDSLPSPTITETISPTNTIEPTITLTATQDKPMVSVSVDTNCRSGPGKIFDYIGALLVGEKAEVVGQSMDGEYWIIKNPDRAGECWLWANYATVTGPTANLPKFTPPPTPTPVFNWAGTWTVDLVPLGGGVVQTYIMTSTVSGKTFSATVTSGGPPSISMSGTISDDYLSVSGNWQNGVSGTFKFYAVGVNQFNGKGYNGTENFGWCGGRGGAGVPSPCYVP